MKSKLIQSCWIGLCLLALMALVSPLYIKLFSSPSVVEPTPVTCSCTPTKCPKPTCPEFSKKAKKRVKQLVLEKDNWRNKYRNVQEGRQHMCAWEEHDFQAYGKSWYKLTPKELKQHDLYKKDIKHAIKVLNAILDGDEL